MRILRLFVRAFAIGGILAGCAVETSGSAGVTDGDPALGVSGTAGYGAGARDDVLIQKAPTPTTVPLDVEVKTGCSSDMGTAAVAWIGLRRASDGVWSPAYQLNLFDSFGSCTTKRIKGVAKVDPRARYNMITLAHDNTGRSPNWYVRSVKLLIGTVATQTCAFEGWVAALLPTPSWPCQ